MAFLPVNFQNKYYDDCVVYCKGGKSLHLRKEAVWQVCVLIDLLKVKQVTFGNHFSNL